MRICRDCGKPMSASANTCPSCGRAASVLSDPKLGAWIWLIVTIFVVAAFAYQCSQDMQAR